MEGPPADAYETSPQCFTTARPDCNGYRVARKQGENWRLLYRACRGDGGTWSNHECHHALVCTAIHGRWANHANIADSNEWSVSHKPPSRSLACNDPQKGG